MKSPERSSAPCTLALASIGLAVPALAQTAPAYPGYELVWSDEFDVDGPPNPENWMYERGLVRNHEDQWYQEENAFVEDGFLVIEARRERTPVPGFDPDSENWRFRREHAEYTSSSFRTATNPKEGEPEVKQEWLYGRFEMRGRIPTAAGMWPAWWTLGKGRRWPGNGEIDIMEYYNGTLLANFFWASPKPFVPAGDVVRTPLEELGDPAEWSTAFHTWRMDWDDEKITLSVDGRVLNELDLGEVRNQTQDAANPFHEPQHMLLNLALGGKSAGDPSGTEFPQRFEVDWVRVYQRIDRE